MDCCSPCSTNAVSQVQSFEAYSCNLVFPVPFWIVSKKEAAVLLGDARCKQEIVRSMGIATVYSKHTWGA